MQIWYSISNPRHFVSITNINLYICEAGESLHIQQRKNWLTEFDDMWNIMQIIEYI